MLKRLSLFMFISIFVFACFSDLTGFKKKDNTTIDNSTGGGNSNGGGNSGDNNGDNPSDNGSGDIGGGKHVTSVVAATASGIYYSNDNGSTWKKSTVPIGANSWWLSLADLGNNIVLAGGGEDSALGLIGTPGHGILKSTDGGVTWKRTSMTQAQWNDILYVGNGVVLAGSNSYSHAGVWRSTDYGDTWSRNIQKNPDERFVPFNKEDADGIIYQIIYTFAKLDDKTIVVGYTYRVGRDNYALGISKDGGQNWYTIRETATSWLPKHVNLVYKILAHRSGALSIGTAGYNGVLNSQLPEVFWDGGGAVYPTNERSFMALAELKSGTILAGASNVYRPNHGVPLEPGGIYRSENDGRSYELIFNKYTWKSFLVLDNGNVLASCTTADTSTPASYCSGLYLGTNDGRIWTPMNNTLNSLTVYNMINVRN